MTGKVTPIRPQRDSFEETLAELERKVAEIQEQLQEIAQRWSKETDWVDLIKPISRFFHSAAGLAQLREFFYAEEVDEFGQDEKFEEKVRPIFDFFFETFWRVEVKGIENVPSEGKALLVANHSGTVPYDGAMVKLAVRREHPAARDVRFLVEDFVYHFPFLGTFYARTGGVRACQENVTRLLDRGQAVITFPEGVKGIGKLYSERYRLQRFGRGGFIRVCMRSGAPIVPIAVVGAEEIHPMIYKLTWFARALGLPYIPVTPTFPWLGPLGLLPMPTKWHIEFGEPIPFHHYTPAQIDNPILVNRLTEQVRQRIQSMIAEMLKKRTSIWR